ncbi:MAG TPA: DUF4097 family beta strand repeat-containing protein [Opitutus sp.]|nr:DUF4097 family beta strand repeat-containing protein [Opitutus sp.]
MKLPLLRLLAIALVAVASVRADDHRYKESFSESGPFNRTGVITLDNVNGQIEITTWDKDEIRIEGEKSAKTQEELKLIELTIDRSASRADIKVKLPKRPGGWFGNNSVRGGVSFRLTVPASASLERITVVNTSIDIDGVQGAVNAQSVNGRIRAHDLGGNARLKSVNGGLTASFKRVVADQTLSFDTVNGSIEIRLPADAGADVQAKVVNGRIDCEFPIEVQGRVGGKRLSGKIGDGRAPLSAESVNGSIRIKKN